MVGKATPSPTEKRGRAKPGAILSWPDRLREIRTCCHCGTIYLNAGFAWRCEHWHERKH